MTRTQAAEAASTGARPAVGAAPGTTARTSPAAPSEPAETRPSAGRVVGLDLARALAVFGMFYAHVGAFADDDGSVTAFLTAIPHGRSSALFATLAGLSLVLLSGGRDVPTGREGRQRAARVVVRAVVLLALGTALTAAGTGIVVILAFYGVCFLLALPFRRLRARTLALLAAGIALVGPLVSNLVLWGAGGWVYDVDERDPITRLGGDGLVSLLFSGAYPAVTWMAYIFAGMALGKLTLGDRATRLRLAIVGPALAVLGYGTSWLLMRLPVLRGIAVPDDELLDEKWEALDKLWETDPDAAEAAFDDLFGDDDSFTGDIGAWGLDSLHGLLSAEAHANTTFEMVGNIGVAIAVIVAAVALLDRCRIAARLLTPVIAVGAMPLTVYVGHVLAYDLLSRYESTQWLLVTGTTTLWFIGVAMVFAVVWSRFFRRGPLEQGMEMLTRLARYVR